MRSQVTRGERERVDQSLSAPQEKAVLPVRLARVVGQVVATAKVPELAGTTILVVEDIDPAPGSSPGRYAAVDLVGAGQEEVVLVVAGSAARVDPATTGVPVDKAIVAIADTVVTHGEVTYSK